MPAISARLDPIGLPRVSVMIRQKQGANCVQTTPLNGVIDNGAQEVFVAPGIFASHGLKPNITGQASMGSGATRAWGCDAEVVILNAGDDSLWMPVRVGEISNMPFPDCEIVIGVSVLRKGLFIYDGVNDRFHLTWS